MHQIRSNVVQQILHGEDELGLTIMKMTAGLDEGPMIYQESLVMPEPLPTTAEAAWALSQQAGRILPTIISQWMRGEITTEPQNHALASYCSKIKKNEAEISLSDPDHINWRKIQAYQPWPKAFFFVDKNNQPTRVVINEASFAENTLNIHSVTPSGYKPMTYNSFVDWLGYDPRN